jgi:hypothetical protein
MATSTEFDVTTGTLAVSAQESQETIFAASRKLTRLLSQPGVPAESVAALQSLLGGVIGQSLLVGKLAEALDRAAA